MSSLTPDTVEEPRDLACDTSMALDGARHLATKERAMRKTVPPPSVAARNLAAIKNHIRRIRTCNNMDMPEYLLSGSRVPQVLFAPPIQNSVPETISRPRSFSADAIYDKQIFSHRIMKKIKKPQLDNLIKTPRKRLFFGENDGEDQDDHMLFI